MLDEGEHQEKDLTAVHLTSKHLRDLKNVSVYGQRLLLTRLMVSLGCHFHSLLMCVIDNSKEHYMLTMMLAMYLAAIRKSTTTTNQNRLFG